MKITYEVYRRRLLSNVYNLLPETFEFVDDAFAVTGHAFGAQWTRTGEDTGWWLDLHVAEGGESWLVTEHKVAETDAERIELALGVIERFGQTDGDHHKAWVIDQVTRALTGDGYEQWVADYCDDETHEWDEGTAP